MKLASYLIADRPAFGVVVDDGLVTLNERLRFNYETLRDVIAANAFGEVKGAAAGAAPDCKLADVTFLPVIPNPGKILLVGINYRSHAAERGEGVAAKPNIFTRFTDTLVGHGGTMLRPHASEQLDYEGELALVIGRAGRAIPEREALAYVAGYSCMCDGSVRDFIATSLITGKNFPATAPFGPWLVTADEIPDPAKLTLETRLNGEVVQHSGTDMLMTSVPGLIAYCSAFTPLAPGDVISTGTPDGIGAKRKPPLWMKAGDTLEVEISQIGTLRARIANER
jgi:2-keto-4-pentenoate hydratase/2-oxohepta-3-ene-1,7-dioic acid hydratase in catechol pathway